MKFLLLCRLAARGKGAENGEVEEGVRGGGLE